MPEPAPGWVTGRIRHAPRSPRSARIAKSRARKAVGRTQEIQRLIGRSLRVSRYEEALGERQIRLDVTACRPMLARTDLITVACLPFHSEPSGAVKIRCCRLPQPVHRNWSRQFPVHLSSPGLISTTRKIPTPRPTRIRAHRARRYCRDSGHRGREAFSAPSSPTPHLAGRHPQDLVKVQRKAPWHQVADKRQVPKLARRFEDSELGHASTNSGKVRIGDVAGAFAISVTSADALGLPGLKRRAQLCEKRGAKPCSVGGQRPGRRWPMIRVSSAALERAAGHSFAAALPSARRGSRLSWGHWEQLHEANRDTETISPGFTCALGAGLAGTNCGDFRGRVAGSRGSANRAGSRSL